MVKKKLQKALENNTSAIANVGQHHKKLTDEELRLQAYNARDNQNNSVTDKMANENVRNTILGEMGFDWFDINSLIPNPNNTYTITDEDVQNLAGLIWNSKEVEPLILRETENGIEIIDGERRWRACKILAEKYGDAWRMVPGRCHKLGAMSDEQANFIMHSSNIGQRKIKPSERAKGFKVLADKLVEWRKNDPKLKGVNTKTYLAEHFDVSERTAQVLLNIARNLSKEGNNLFDKGKITQTQAEALSKLSSLNQAEVIKQIENTNPASEDITRIIENNKVNSEEQSSKISTNAKGSDINKKHKTQKDLNAYLRTAKNAMKKANKQQAKEIDFKLLGEVKALIRELERKYE